MAMSETRSGCAANCCFIVMLTCGSALVFAGATFSIHEIDEVRQSKLGEMTLAANLIGANSTAALSFRDAQAAAETLQTLGTDRHIVAARIYDAQGAPFATWMRPGVNDSDVPPLAEPDAGSFAGGVLRLSSGIYLDGRRVGSVFLERDLDELRAGIVRYGFHRLRSASGFDAVRLPAGRAAAAQHIRSDSGAGSARKLHSRRRGIRSGRCSGRLPGNRTPD